jgi:hypothetical protein
MQRNKLMIAGGIFALLLGYVLFTQTGNRGFNTVKLPTLPKMDASTLVRVEIKRPQGTVVLEKKAEGWTLVEPLVFPVDKNKLENLQRTLSELRLTDMITEQVNRDADFGVTSTTATALVVVDNKQKRLEMMVGKLNAAGTHTFVRFLGDFKVYQVLGDLPSALDAPAPDWRSLQIYDLGSDAVQGFSVTVGKKTLTVSKEQVPVEAPAGTTATAKTMRSVWRASSDTPPLNDMKVEQWTMAFTRLAANRIVDAPGAIKGILGQVQVKTTQGALTLEFLSYLAKDKVYWVRRAGETTVYEIPDYQGQNLLKEAKDLQ